MDLFCRTPFWYGFHSISFKLQDNSNFSTLSTFKESESQA